MHRRFELILMLLKKHPSTSVCTAMDTSMDKDGVVMAVALISHGAAFLAGGIAHLMRRKRMEKNWPRTEASVEGVNYDRDGNRVLTLVFESGDRSKHGVVATGSDTVGLGSVVTVAYAPNNPARATIIGRGGVSSWTYIMIIIGSLLLFVGFRVSI